MADKIIRNINPNTWRMFTGLCKMKGVRVGEELNKILEEYLKDVKGKM